MRSFNVPRFQYCLFKKLKEKIDNLHNISGRDDPLVTITPTTAPTYEFYYPDIIGDEKTARQYASFVSSVYLVEIQNVKFYFVFRNSRDVDRKTNTIPSSVEVICMFNDQHFHRLLKGHYVAGENDSLSDYCNLDFISDTQECIAVTVLCGNIIDLFVNCVKFRENELGGFKL